MQKALKVMSTTQLAKKIGKTQSFVVDMAGDDNLVITLDKNY
ncbi:MAG TPA: hypothetical protein VFI70_05065 [Nitrososphaeraceae archaeon]|nr:hypothetical protein [Nitrososphaeraceae archaeon]